MNIIKRKDWKLICISDCHAGHVAGLCPPQWQGKFIDEDVSKHNKFVKIQRSMWKFFSDEIIKIKKNHENIILVSNGDILDGLGNKSSGVEQLTTNRTRQIAIAKNIIEFIDADKVYLISGTDYHVSGGKSGGGLEEFEEILARELNCSFENHCWLEISKKVWDFKHHISSSSVPQGRFTPLGNVGLWSKLWSEAGLVPNSDYIIRSHVHYFSLAQNSYQTCLTTPALQGFGSKFGSKICQGLIDVGFISFDVKTDGSVCLYKHFMNLVQHKAKAVVIE